MNTYILALPNPNPSQPAEPETGGGLMQFLPFLLVIVVIMFLMPLFSKKERKRQKRLGDLKKHDRVVTSGGIYGTIVALDEQTVTLEVAKDVRFRIKRSSVYDMEKPGEEKGTEAPKKAGAKS